MPVSVAGRLSATLAARALQTATHRRAATIGNLIPEEYGHVGLQVSLGIGNEAMALGEVVGCGLVFALDHGMDLPECVCLFFGC